MSGFSCLIFVLLKIKTGCYPEERDLLFQKRLRLCIKNITFGSEAESYSLSDIVLESEMNLRRRESKVCVCIKCGVCVWCIQAHGCVHMQRPEKNTGYHLLFLPYCLEIGLLTELKDHDFG